MATCWCAHDWVDLARECLVKNLKREVVNIWIV